MSRRVVIDAAAALRLVLAMRGADRILAGLREASIVLAPGLFCSEVANGLWKYVAAGELEAGESLERLEEALSLADRIVPDPPLALEALSEANRREHPVYDLVYAVLARRNGCSLLTTDARLRDVARMTGVETCGPTPD